jgi:ATP-dependent Lon protease
MTMEPEAQAPALELPSELPVLPLRGTVIYPFTVAPLTIGQERSGQLVDAVMRGNRLLTVVAQREAEVENAGPDDLYGVGTAARIAQMARSPEGELVVLIQGVQRVRITSYSATEPFLFGRIEPAPDEPPPADDEQALLQVTALQRNLVQQFQRLAELANLPREMAAAASQLEDPIQTVYLVASATRLDPAVRQELLELNNVSEKLQRLCGALGREIEILEIGQRMQNEAQTEMSKAQREYFLREQLKAIQRELGEDDPARAETAELRRKLEEARLPELARREAERELERMETIPPASPERGMIRTYLDWMAGLPWQVSSGGDIDVERAGAVLDEDHHDLEKVKERILEYLAVRKLKQERHAVGEISDTGATSGKMEAVAPLTPVDEAMHEPILCLVGPPGVGKTSLGQSIARAMGRKFVRISLGGIRDEAEVRGHRRTYIGAMPGRIIQGLRRAETNDPIFMLDELDKLTVGFQGDPAAALLEVLDPSQNSTFEDNYLGVPFDLSKVLFVCTANVIQNIPGPLLDRMEVLEIPGYTDEEKILIAERYLVERQRRANGLRSDEITFERDALRRIVRDYTREAGVRDLERQIGTIIRKIARDVASAASSDGRLSSSVTITPERVAELLGKPRFTDETVERVDRPGVVTGLAWTPVGGDVLFVEAATLPGQSDRLVVTGQLGDVMRESVQAALTYLQTSAESYGIDPKTVQDRGVHVHVPAGAIPKDGPSAGVTMLAALASIMTGRPVRHDLAMTGEITLRGKVLPVGGIKEKVLAAHRAGIKTVLLPRQNERDLEGVPDDLRKELKVIPIDTAEQVLHEALGLTKVPAKAARPGPTARTDEDERTARPRAARSASR